jgi:hypothetical protein
MTKFDKFGKTEQSVLHSGCSGFNSFRVGIKEGDNMRKSEVQVCLRHGKGGRSIKEQVQRRFKPKVEATKTEGLHKPDGPIFPEQIEFD